MPYEKYSPKQKKLAAVAEPRDKITGADLKALGGRKKLSYGGSARKKMKNGGKMVKGPCS